MKHSLHILVTFVALTISDMVPAQSVIIGIGRAKDGDTLTVGDSEVRLFGIDAPEFDQTCKRDGQGWNCGAAAADALMQLVTGKEVQCLSVGTDQYGRILGRCSVGRADINQSMVGLGYAIAHRRYSRDYVPAEEVAKAGKLGVWAGSFQAPEEYRKTGGDTSMPTARTRHMTRRPPTKDWAQRAQSNCNIKGNRNRKGQWIYHLPWMPYYDQTRPEEIFCSEAEAQAAGYRRAIVR